MAKFAYKNTKNMSTNHMPFKLNCGYYYRVSYQEDIELFSKSNSADELSAKLAELMILC